METVVKNTPPEVRRLQEDALREVGDHTEYYDNGHRVIATLTSIRPGGRTITMMYMLGDNLAK